MYCYFDSTYGNRTHYKGLMKLLTLNLDYGKHCWFMQVNILPKFITNTGYQASLLRLVVETHRPGFVCLFLAIRNFKHLHTYTYTDIHTYVPKNTHTLIHIPSHTLHTLLKGYISYQSVVLNFLKCS